MTKKKRQEVFDKFGGRCAYTGLPLGDDWQVDHVEAIALVEYYCSGKIGYEELRERNNSIENLMPALKIVNHYKRGLKLESFRTWYLGGLHERLKKLPKNPKSPASIRRKQYLFKVAEAFGITPEKPFNGKFYFETI